MRQIKIHNFQLCSIHQKYTENCSVRFLKPLAIEQRLPSASFSLPCYWPISKLSLRATLENTQRGWLRWVWWQQSQQGCFIPPGWWLVGTCWRYSNELSALSQRSWSSRDVVRSRKRWRHRKRRSCPVSGCTTPIVVPHFCSCRVFPVQNVHSLLRIHSLSFLVQNAPRSDVDEDIAITRLAHCQKFLTHIEESRRS